MARGRYRRAMENRRLAPELVLLGLNPDGRVVGRAPGFDFALAGAVLLDLVLAERIDVVDKRVMVLDATPLGDPVLDDAVAAVATGRPRRAKDWVRRLFPDVPRRQLRARLAEISRGNWASAAVTAAVRDVQAAMIAVAAAAAAGAASG